MTRRTVWALARHRDGGAAVEMALLVPLMAGIMFAAFDLAGAAHMRLRLQEAANRGAELALASQTIADDMNPMLAEARTAYGQPLHASQMANWLECDGVAQANLTVDCGTRERARYLSLTLEAEYVPRFGLGGLLRGPQPSGGWIMRGSAVVRLQ